MNAANASKGYLILLAVLVLATVAPAADQAADRDESLAAATKLVAASDKYLHHSKLKRGMKGHGLTVLAGVNKVKFNAEIVSVVTQWSPHQSVILARLTGHDLEKTGVIAGMSGSPVYMTDPADGKVKMIGAVAYGWLAQKEALCGIQPITQMLAIPGALPGSKPAKTDKAPKGQAKAASNRELSEDFVKAVLNPKKIDFSTLAMPRSARAKFLPLPGGGRLAPITTPLTISGGSEQLMAALQKCLTSSGIVPVQGVASVKGTKLPDPGKLSPGSAIAVPIVTGDLDWSATGTVTEVIGDRVLAFGHGFYNDGKTRFPIGPAYVHTVISGVLESFKLSSSYKSTGVLEHDSYVGISGRTGPKVSMVPMTVSVDWKPDGRKQVYHYNIVRHKWLTPMLVSMLIRESAWAWRELPEFHTVRYSSDLDFGKLGKYHCENISSFNDVSGAVSDTTRPVVALLNNDLGPKPELRSVNVQITVEEGDRRASIMDFKLDGKAYQPGETVTGAMTVRAFKRKREKLPLTFKLPDDLPEGDYSLTICEADANIMFATQETPQKFQARTVEELLAAIKELVSPKATDVYLRLPLKEGGLALGRKELPDLPDSRALIIKDAGQLDTKSFSKTLVRSMPTPYVLHGSAEASFTVVKRTNEIRLKK